MDFGNAVIIVGAIVAGTELVKRLALRLLGITIDDGITQVVTMVVAVALMFLMRATVWASTQVIGEHTLDKLSALDVVFAAVLLGLVGNVVDRILKTVANIGENTTDPPK